MTAILGTPPGGEVVIGACTVLYSRWEQADIETKRQPSSTERQRCTQTTPLFLDRKLWSVRWRHRRDWTATCEPEIRRRTCAVRRIVKYDMMFLVVKVNCPPYVFNISKSIWILRNMKKLGNFRKSARKCTPDDLFTFASDDVIPGKQTTKQAIRVLSEPLHYTTLQ